MSSRTVQAAEAAAGQIVSVLYDDGVFRDKRPNQTHVWSRKLLLAFLPEGYPHSVTEDYAST